MTEQTTAQVQRAEYEAQTEHGGHDHPGERTYVGIAVILAVLTAAEVATYYFEDQLGGLLVPALIVMMIVKFFLVVAWFMHLRFDSNVFTRMFVSGLFLAIGVYLATLATFRFFT